MTTQSRETLSSALGAAAGPFPRSAPPHRQSAIFLKFLRLAAILAIFMGTVASLRAQSQSGTNSNSLGNSDPTYQALRNLGLGRESFSVSNLDLKREAGTFHLRSGTICFTDAVEGQITGAVFEGDGSFVLDAPPSERAMLKLLTREDQFDEAFSQMVLRFTDSTADEVRKAGTASQKGCDSELLKESQRSARNVLRENLEARMLGDVLTHQPGGFFLAFIHGKHYDNREIYAVDPRENVDQVRFFTFDENKTGLWASFPLAGNAPGMPVRIEHQQLDTAIESNASLSGKAATTFRSRVDKLQVVPFDLFPALRVQSVSADGQPLQFIQEESNKDAQFAVILPKSLAAGESMTVTTTYSGKGAVTREGNGNYFPVSRTNWFPNNPYAELGEFVPYDMTFRIPKGMQMAATGALLNERNDGSQNVSVWKSETPQTVAGFNFGKFEVEQTRLQSPDYLVQAFANQDPPDWVKSLELGRGNDAPINGGYPSGGGLGTMNTTLLNKKALAEGELALRLYTDYFGPSSFKRLQITQQSACNFGQSWPGLVWIPLCYYFDTTVRHGLGLDLGDRGYWKVVTAHEVAHQWWGHTVGFSSYRDQWMSEGFADMSASLYLTVIDKDPKKFVEFWNDERDLLLERNAQGFRAIDAGPVTMGYRLSNSRAGFDVTRRLIYPKGAYILHMIRMMMLSNSTGDQLFKQTMQDFVKTYAGKAATTEDFKSLVEQHMTPEMDLDRNHRLDWFFNEYVYGTQLPSYKVDSSFEIGGDGNVVMDIKIVQSGVGDDFRMLVPVYVERADGSIELLFRVPIVGNNEWGRKITIQGMTAKPRRAMVNYYDDVLATPK